VIYTETIQYYVVQTFIRHVHFNWLELNEHLTTVST